MLDVFSLFIGFGSSPSSCFSNPELFIVMKCRGFLSFGEGSKGGLEVGGKVKKRWNSKNKLLNKQFLKSF